MKIAAIGTVTHIWRDEHNKHISGVKDEATFETVYGDYYIVIDKLYSFNVGPDKPNIEKGAKVRFIIEGIDTGASA